MKKLEGNVLFCHPELFVRDLAFTDDIANDLKIPLGKKPIGMTFIGYTKKISFRNLHTPHMVMFLI